MKRAHLKPLQLLLKLICRPRLRSSTVLLHICNMVQQCVALLIDNSMQSSQWYFLLLHKIEDLFLAMHDGHIQNALPLLIEMLNSVGILIYYLPHNLFYSIYSCNKQWDMLLPS